MAGKTKDMSKIKQLLLLKKDNVSNRKAAELLGFNKETVNRYVQKANADDLGIDGLLALDDPVLEHRLKGGSPAYSDERFEVFKELLPYLQDEMKRPHVTLKLLSSVSTTSRTRGQRRMLRRPSLLTGVPVARRPSSTSLAIRWDILTVRQVNMSSASLSWQRCLQVTTAT